MKTYITKYALTKGILEMEGEICEGLCNDWHRTIEAARSRAGAMRSKKIQSLKKQIAKLEGMRF